MLVKPPECSNCPLERLGRGFSNPEGSGALRVLMLGEALGEHEANDGLPFRPYAPAGMVLERILRRSGKSRPQLAIFNAGVNCQPPGNKLEHAPYEHGAIEHCQVHVRRVVEQYGGARASKEIPLKASEYWKAVEAGDPDVRMWTPEVDAEPQYYRLEKTGGTGIAVMLALGGVALRVLTGYAGKKQTITNVRGFILDGIRFPIPVVGTYHPSYILRDKPNLYNVARRDLLLACQLAAKDGRFQRPTKRYIKFPQYPEALAWVERFEQHVAAKRGTEEVWLAHDIETEESIVGVEEDKLRAAGGGRVEIRKVEEEREDAPSDLDLDDEVKESVEVRQTRITQIQFCYDPPEAIIFPWQEPFIGLAKRVMAVECGKVGWNSWAFDDPLEQEAGVVIGGESVDAMWSWHALQPDLPRGLQYAMSFYFPEALPWKHRAQEDAGEYGGDDVRYLREALPRMYEQLRRDGVWPSYERHVLRQRPILVRAQERGILVDEEQRGELGTWLDVQRDAVDAELQGRFPDELRRCEPKEGYKRDADAERRRATAVLEKGEKWGRREFDDCTSVREGKDGDGGGVSGQAVRGADEGGDVGSVPGGAVGEGPGRVGKAGGAMVERWCRLQPFKPNSGPQILSYIRWKRAEEIRDRIGRRRQIREVAERNAVYVVPWNRKEKRDTTEKKELQRLARKTGDDFFLKCIQHREFGKLKGTYVDGWEPAEDGRVHTTFGWSPPTGQTSSRGPCVQNPPKRGEIAQRFRRIIISGPGYRLISLDYKSFHALTLGFEARCPEYCRLARLGIHSFVAAHLLKLPERDRLLALADEELQERLDRIAAEHGAARDKAKSAILGIGFGLESRTLYEQNQEIFEGQGEAAKLIDMIFGLFPRVKRWQGEVVALAKRQGGFLFNHFWRRRWFPGIYHGDQADAKACIAYLPSSDAFGIKDEVKLRLEDRGAMERFGFINDIHDEFLFDCPDPLVEEAIHVVREEMERPSERMVDPELAPEGLVCRVGVKVGRNWAGRTGDNPEGMEEIKG